MFKNFIFFLIFSTLIFLEFNSLWAQESKSNFAFGVNFGYSRFLMTDLNNAIELFQSEGFGCTNNIDGGFQITGHLIYKISNNISLSAAIGYAYVRAELAGILTGVNEFTLRKKFKIRFLPVSACLFVNRKIGDINVNLGGSIDYNFGILTEEAESEYPDYLQNCCLKKVAKGSNSGLCFFVNPEYVISSKVSLNCEIGYRIAKISNLQGDNIYVGDFTLDFSGLFFNLGPRFYF